jgi:hypothetical protein
LLRFPLFSLFCSKITANEIKFLAEILGRGQPSEAKKQRALSLLFRRFFALEETEI